MGLADEIDPDPTGDAGVADSGLEDPALPELTLDDVAAELDEVDAALVRLDAGTYGRCAVCDASLDDVRLASRPTAAACADHEGAA